MSKPGEVGARRAERKKIVLANPNATDAGLETLEAQVSDNADGTVVKFDGSTTDMLKALEVFQVKQGWQFFYEPSTLIRKESIELGKLLAWVNGEGVRSGEGRGVESQGKSAGGEIVNGNVSEGVTEGGSENASRSEIKSANEGEGVGENVSENDSEVKSANESSSENQSHSGSGSDSEVGGQVVEEGCIPSGGYVTTPEVIPEVPVDELKKYKDLAGESRSGRMVITGPKGVGKSILLLQAMAWAQKRDWLVLPIPNGMYSPAQSPPFRRTNLPSLYNIH